MTTDGITDNPPLGKRPSEGQVQEGAWLALSVLVLINLFNFIDRQVLAAVEPEISKEFFGVMNPVSGEIEEVPGANFRMGLLMTVFLWAYFVSAPIFGMLANRVSRWRLIAFGVIVWTVASGGSGLAGWWGLGGAYLFMLITRCLVGVGEGAYGPVAPDMISDMYPIQKRGQVLAWFYAAIPVGAALGYALGETAKNLSGTWRTGFFVVVPPGILLAIWCFLLPAAPRGKADQAAVVVRRRQSWSDYLLLLKVPSYVITTLGMTAMTFAMGGLALWVPKYLEKLQVTGFFGVGPRTVFGIFLAVAGLAATLLGGIAGDRLRKRFSGSYFLVSGTAMILAFPTLLLVTYVPFPWAWLPLVAAVFFLFFNTGPTNTILANVTHPLLRAPGFAFNIFAIHLFGDAISPSIMGLIIDRYPEGEYGPVAGLQVAFRVVSVTALLGGLVWLWGMKYLGRDTELAPHRLPPEQPPATET